MQRQLNEQFINDYLIKFVKRNVIGRIDKDKILQKIFTTEEPLEPSELDDLTARYFQDQRGVLFETDFEARKLFFNEFITFVRRQRKICSENMALLTIRLLPLDAATNTFDPEAEKNWLKFCFQFVNAFQNAKISRNISNKEANC
jgi:hypothetical protein